METFTLTNNKEKQRYEFSSGEAAAAIEYIQTENNELVLTRTEVAPGASGRGIGSRAVEAVLTEAERRGMKIIPQCPFIISYIRKHPEWKRIVLRGIMI